MRFYGSFNYLLHRTYSTEFKGFDIIEDFKNDIVNQSLDFLKDMTIVWLLFSLIGMIC